MEYGIQLYSIRDVAEKDLKEALRICAELGYKFVEFAGFFGNCAEDVLSWLEEFGLKAIGTHTCPEDIEGEKIDEVIAYHKALGCKYLSLPYGLFSTNEKFDGCLELIREAGKRLAEVGITLCFHNHASEFRKTAFGREPMSELIEKTDVSLEPDVFWVATAGRDPLSFLEENKSRVKLLHLKDGKIYKEPSPGAYGADGLSLGLGDIPVADIVRWAKENSVPIIVESEGLEPTGPDEVGRCIDYLKSIE